MPWCFDSAPLAPHHKVIGRWAASRAASEDRFTRAEARRHIERVFNRAVLEILRPFKLAELRTVVLLGSEERPPAIAIICDTIGQIELGWIEETSGLLSAVFAKPDGRVAPASWGAAAYAALTGTLGNVLPIFNYQDLIEEFSNYYWDGETDDVAASKALIEFHGMDPDEVDEETLPSAVNGKRPPWMLAENAALIQHLPTGLRARIRRLRKAHKAFMRDGLSRAAWLFDFDALIEYAPDYEDRAHLPGLTLVPADKFGRELDEMGRWGMEQGFMDIAGLCPLGDPNQIDAWFDSLRLGAEVLLAAQDLIQSDPTND